jgi:hypothetical protein
VAYYDALKMKAATSRSEETKSYEYFPMDHTIRRLLPAFGDLLGMRFSKILPGSQAYIAIVSAYLRHESLLERQASLSVFAVGRNTSIGSVIGYLVLDLVERDGKLRRVYCQDFGAVYSPRSHIISVSRITYLARTY